MDVSFCVAVLERRWRSTARRRFSTPTQGSQFTSTAFTGALAGAGIKISMNGHGRWMDNVFIEQLWRSLNHENIYIEGYADGREAKGGIANWIAFYNDRRLHQALGYRAPMALWRERMRTGRLWTW
ncbi:integrase core domain-containing protein [Bradyrhizobium sp. GCM10028915]|uniref:integrase core domain-containing protein n=1 Tax=Bradyrhizobium sp. GCM10028915 TaxID=3273385 RepID=UPI0036133E28